MHETKEAIVKIFELSHISQNGDMWLFKKSVFLLLFNMQLMINIVWLE